MKKLCDVQISLKQLAVALLLLGSVAAGGYYFFLLNPQPLVSDIEEGLRAHKTHTEASKYFKEEGLNVIHISIAIWSAGDAPLEVDYAGMVADDSFIWLNGYSELPEHFRLHSYGAFGDIIDAAMQKCLRKVSVLIDTENDLIVGFWG